MRWLRPSEWLLVVYFGYAAVFSGELLPPGGFVLAGVAAAAVLSRAESQACSRLLSVVRDWLPAPLVLVAYWAVDWFPRPAYSRNFEPSWIGLDRLLLHGWGAKAAIESLGPVLPSLLELCYSLLYAVTPVSIGILYLYRRRARVDRFLFTLLLGTLATYALLPHFASQPPTVAFPGEDLPAVTTPFRLLNLWLLGHFDIRISVFPSGHVTLGFSAAFAMLLALPEKRRAGWILLVLACGVAVATVYGRYHYAVDGLAGLGVSLLAAAASYFVHSPLARRTG
ncbi:MAG: phosphatase PAP2 family protein [Acidobacteria bacterium]|nr:phosphatase PAP2 family protein [Acidobacteriota bacterium]